MAERPTTPPLPVPDVTSDLPPGYPVANDARIQRFLDAPQAQIDELTAAITTTLRALQLPHATGAALDTLGWARGPLGLRRGRGDDALRQHLRALPNAFRGLHRRKDIRRAIAAGVVADSPDDVALEEDVEGNTYSVTLHSWQGHAVSLVDFLAGYADVVGVERSGPITYDWGAAPPRETGTGASTSTTVDLGTAPPRVGDTGGASAVVEREDGFGGFEFDEGYKFDVEEPVDLPISDVAESEYERVAANDHQSAESPLSVAGWLSVSGRLSVEDNEQ